ncbi:hypothetical protein B0H10DRAFT_2218057 [Mycena sp. CBHHK59/15]|nr:hypothetical protein B0H10DRAFT_2218057 [Mycena sp. CBHHK59/15]
MDDGTDTPDNEPTAPPNPGSVGRTCHAAVFNTSACDINVFECTTTSNFTFMTTPPVPSRSSHTLLLIDGLDECEDEQAQTKILCSIGDAVRESPIPLRFLIACQPEPQIQQILQETDLTDLTWPFNITQWFADVEQFLREEFGRIHAEHRYTMAKVPTPWPSKDILDFLVRSSGYFIYASTVLKFVDDKNYCPTQRLAIVLGLRTESPESPFHALDQLYTQILSSVVTRSPVAVHAINGPPASPNVEKTSACVTIVEPQIVVMVAKAHNADKGFSALASPCTLKAGLASVRTFKGYFEVWRSPTERTRAFAREMLGSKMIDSLPSRRDTAGPLLYFARTSVSACSTALAVDPVSLVLGHACIDTHGTNPALPFAIHVISLPRPHTLLASQVGTDVFPQLSLAVGAVSASRRSTVGSAGACADAWASRTLVRVRRGRARHWEGTGDVAAHAGLGASIGVRVWGRTIRSPAPPRAVCTRLSRPTRSGGYPNPPLALPSSSLKKRTYSSVACKCPAQSVIPASTTADSLPTFSETSVHTKMTLATRFLVPSCLRTLSLLFRPSILCSSGLAIRHPDVPLPDALRLAVSDHDAGLLVWRDGRLFPSISSSMTASLRLAATPEMSFAGRRTIGSAPSVRPPALLLSPDSDVLGRPRGGDGVRRVGCHRHPHAALLRPANRTSSPWKVSSVQCPWWQRKESRAASTRIARKIVSSPSGCGVRWGIRYAALTRIVLWNPRVLLHLWRKKRLVPLVILLLNEGVSAAPQGALPGLRCSRCSYGRGRRARRDETIRGVVLHAARGGNGGCAGQRELGDTIRARYPALTRIVLLHPRVVVVYYTVSGLWRRVFLTDGFGLRRSWEKRGLVRETCSGSWSCPFILYATSIRYGMDGRADERRGGHGYGIGNVWTIDYHIQQLTLPRREDEQLVVAGNLGNVPGSGGRRVGRPSQPRGRRKVRGPAEVGEGIVILIAVTGGGWDAKDEDQKGIGATKEWGRRILLGLTARSNAGALEKHRRSGL